MQEFSQLTFNNSKKWMHIHGDWRRPHIDGAYEIFWDDDTLFGQIIPRPSSEQVSEFYELDHYYTHGTTVKPRQGSTGFIRKLLSHLAWKADHGIEIDQDCREQTLGKEPLSILEIGCGSGKHLDILKSLGHTVVGVEPDAKALTQAANAGLEVWKGTAERLPKEVWNKTFDVVIFMHVLEHCLDPIAAITNAKKLLSKDGICIAEVPNCSPSAPMGSIIPIA